MFCIYISYGLFIFFTHNNVRCVDKPRPRSRYPLYGNFPEQIQVHLGSQTLPPCTPSPSLRCVI